MSINIETVEKHIVAAVNERGHWEYKSGSVSVSIRKGEGKYQLIVRQSTHEHMMESPCLFKSLTWIMRGLDTHWLRLHKETRDIELLKQRLDGLGDVEALRMP